MLRTISRVVTPNLSHPRRYLSFTTFKPSHSFLNKSINNPDEPIIYLPELFGTKEAFKTEANDICQTLETEVYSVELGTELAEADPAELAAEVAEWSKKEVGDKVLVVGEGQYGCHVGMALAQHLEVVKFVGIEGLPTALGSKIDHYKQLQTALEAVAGSRISKFDNGKFEKCLQVFDQAGLDKLSSKYMLQNVVGSADSQFLKSKWQVDDKFLDKFAEWHVDTPIHCPALFVLGRKSFLFPHSIEETVALKKSVASIFTDSTIKAFNGSHFVAKEQSASVVNAICQFLLKERNEMYDELRGAGGI